MRRSLIGANLTWSSIYGLPEVKAAASNYVQLHTKGVWDKVSVGVTAPVRLHVQSNIARLQDINVLGI